MTKSFFSFAKKFTALLIAVVIIFSASGFAPQAAAQEFPEPQSAPEIIPVAQAQGVGSAVTGGLHGFARGGLIGAVLGCLAKGAAGAAAGALAGGVGAIPGFGAGCLAGLVSGAAIGGAVGTATGAASSYLFGNIFEECDGPNPVCWGLAILKGVLLIITQGVLFLGGQAIHLGADLIMLGINLNGFVVQAPFVASGFKISLALANLGFVLLIIIIAFGTILRFEGYGIKQLLAKLILAAVLVNFSLALAGVFIDFSHILAGYFMDASTGENRDQFAKSLVAALAPQNLLSQGEKNRPTLKDTPYPGSELPLVNEENLDSENKRNIWGNFFKVFTNLIFVTIFTVLAAIVMLGIAATTIARYVVLSILLVLMPLAWLFWAFPELTGLWKKWWSTFLQWTFYLPAATFFLYLTVLTLVTSGTPAAFGDSGFVASILQTVVAVALLFGSLVVAKSMSIAGADLAIKAASGAGKFALGFTGRKALQYGTAPLRAKGTGEGAKSAAERIQDWASKTKIPLLRTGAGLISSGVQKLATAGGENLVKQAQPRVAKMSTAEKQAALLTAGEPLRNAILIDLTKNQQLEKIDTTRFINETTKAMFLKYGQGRAFDDMEKTAGMNIKMVNALKLGLEDGMKSAAAEFYATFTDTDKKKTQANDIYKSTEAFGVKAGAEKEMFHRATSHGIAARNPGMMATIAPKLNEESFKKYDQTMQDAIFDLPTATEEQKKALKRASDAFEKSLARRLGGGFEEPEPTTTPTPPKP